jgi:cytochrome c oxidase subunit 1
MWQSGHTMTVLVSMALMWMGVLYHHYPVITGRQIDEQLGNLFVKLCAVGCVGGAVVMLAGGAAGMPRRFADWGQGGWMGYGTLILIFGLILGIAYVVYAVSLYRSREIAGAEFNKLLVDGGWGTVR